MVELSLLASSGFPSAILYQDHQGLHKTPPPKEFHSGLSFNGRKQDAVKSSSVQFDVHQSEELLHPMSMLSGSNQSSRMSPMIRKTVLMDVQDSHANSVLFSLGIAEKCIRNENIMELLRSRSKFTKGEDLDVSLLSEVMGLHDVAIDMLSPHHVLRDDKFSLYNSEMNDHDHPLHILKQIYAPEFQLDFGWSLSDTLYHREDQDGQLLFPDNPAKIDLLSIVSEFNLPKRSPIGSKSLLVPYFTRRGRRRSQTQKQVTTPTVAPVKSSEVPKQKPISKKKKKSTERDLYQRNSFHAFERLLSVLLNANGSTSVVSLKKSGPEISQVLTKISAAIAGTGLAIIFSVAYKVACGSVALCATRVLSTGCGLGLFWLSWAINGLRDTLVYLSKHSVKSNPKEEEVACMVKRSMNEILFRTMALVAVTVLRFA